MSDISKINNTNPQAAMALAGSSRAEAEMNKLKQLDPKSTEAVDKAAKGFESMLVGQLLKSMWETVESTGMLGENSYQGQIYRDMFNERLADQISDGRGIGLKSFMKRELMQHELASKPQAGSKEETE